MNKAEKIKERENRVARHGSFGVKERFRWVFALPKRATNLLTHCPWLQSICTEVKPCPRSWPIKRCADESFPRQENPAHEANGPMARFNGAGHRDPRGARLPS